MKENTAPHPSQIAAHALPVFSRRRRSIQSYLAAAPGDSSRGRAQGPRRCRGCAAPRGAAAAGGPTPPPLLGSALSRGPHRHARQPHRRRRGPRRRAPADSGRHPPLRRSPLPAGLRAPPRPPRRPTSRPLHADREPSADSA